MFVCCFLRQPQPPPPPLQVNARNGHDEARLRPVAGHKRALWTPATHAPFSSILSHLQAVGGGDSAAAYTPAARRRAGSLRSVYVGERWHKHKGGLEYGIDNLVDNFVEIFLFDTAEAALNVTLDVARNDMTLDEAGLRKREACHHLVGQRIGVLRVEPIVGSDENEVEHTVLVLLQLVGADDDGGMWLERAVGEKEADFYDVALMILHR